MFNAPRPNPEDLPTPAQLRRSTVLAALGAVAIAVCVVMPAEYGDDPTGVGALLGLTEMGEIKSQLAREAEEDHASLWRRGLQGAAADCVPTNDLLQFVLLLVPPPLLSGHWHLRRC